MMKSTVSALRPKVAPGINKLVWFILLVVLLGLGGGYLISVTTWRSPMVQVPTAFEADPGHNF
jgi:hypothetical protein